MSINLKKVPNTPGVYKFFKNHEIIYIGKAKNLIKRVSSYFRKSIKDRKTSQIKFLTDKIETFTTKNEVEALLLEQMLIKENKPKNTDQNPNINQVLNEIEVINKQINQFNKSINK